MWKRNAEIKCWHYLMYIIYRMYVMYSIYRMYVMYVYIECM